MREKEGEQYFVIPPLQCYYACCHNAALYSAEGYNIISNDLYMIHIDSSIWQINKLRGAIIVCEEASTGYTFICVIIKSITHIRKMTWV